MPFSPDRVPSRSNRKPRLIVVCVCLLGLEKKKKKKKKKGLIKQKDDPQNKTIIKTKGKSSKKDDWDHDETPWLDARSLVPREPFVIVTEAPTNTSTNLNVGQPPSRETALPRFFHVVTVFRFSQPKRTTNTTTTTKKRTQTQHFSFSQTQTQRTNKHTTNQELKQQQRWETNKPSSERSLQSSSTSSNRPQSN